MSSTELANNQSFQEKMLKRIRDSIGELMSDDEIKAILERGVEDALFKPRLRSVDSWGKKQADPPLVDQAIDKYLKEQMERQIADWISRNQARLKEAVEKAASKGAGRCMLAFLDSKFEVMFSAALQEFKNDNAGQGYN